MATLNKTSWIVAFCRKQKQKQKKQNLKLFIYLKQNLLKVMHQKMFHTFSVYSFQGKYEMCVM